MRITCATCGGSGTIDISVRGDAIERGKTLLSELADLRGTTLAEIVGPRRLPALVAIRREAAQLMRDETSLTLKAIGLLLGHRDHSTIHHYLYGKRARTASATPGTGSDGRRP